MEKNYKMTLAYDGTRFFGWERQPGRETIQGKLESVLSKLAEKPVEVIGAGGHAAAHFVARQIMGNGNTGHGQHHAPAARQIKRFGSGALQLGSACVNLHRRKENICACCLPPPRCC